MGSRSILSSAALSVGLTVCCVWAALVAASNAAQAHSTREPLVDACLEWGSAFCSSGDVSEIPDYGPGSVAFHQANPSGLVGQRLSLMINKSLPETEHTVYACRPHQGSGGFRCVGLGSFMTNHNGYGRFHWRPEPSLKVDGCIYDHLAINVPVFATIVATPMEQDLFPCAP